MHRLRNMPIRRKLHLLVVLSSGFALLLAGIGIFSYEAITFRSYTARDLTMIARLVADNSAVALELQEAKDAEGLLASLEVHPHIVLAGVYDRHGKLFVRYRQPGLQGLQVPVVAPETMGHSFDDDFLTVVQPVVAGGERVGVVFLQSDLEELSSRFWRLAMIGVVIMLLSLWGGVAMAGRLRRVIAAPMLELAATASRVAAERNYSLRAKGHGEDELGRLIDGFNNMLGEIQNRDLELEKARLELEQRVEQRTRELSTSQQLYASLVTALPMHVFRKDPEGRFTFCNQRFAADLSRHPSDILGKTDFDFFPAEMAQQYRADDLTVMHSGKGFESVESHQRPDGERVHVQVMKTPLLDENGAVCGIQGLFWDVTARKRAEEELAAERDLLRALLDSSPDCIYFKDAKSRFIKCSRAVAERAGYADPSLVLGKTDFDLFSIEHAQQAFDDERQIIATGKPIIGKLERETRPSGGDAWVYTTKMPLRDPGGVIVGTFGISRDVTELKKAEAKLEATHRQLMEASRQAGMAEIATGVLHNVGNILNSLNVSGTLISENLRKSKISSLPKLVQLLRQHQDDLAAFLTQDPRGQQLTPFLAQLSDCLAEEHESQLVEVGTLKKNVEHIREIVAMQQSYAKMGGLAEEVDLVELVEDALHLNAGALARHDIQVTREFRQVPMIVVEKHKVLQILVNLIRNAKYACDEGREHEKRLTVRLWNGDGGVHVAVEDNGVGIPAENLTRIFGHGFTTRKNGHGFGLHSAAVAAREMGGALRAQSEGHGMGARFTLDLPIGPPRAHHA